MVMCDSKSCFKCGVQKPLSEFYKHKKMADGHLNKCKDCAKKDVRQNRGVNLDYYKEYDKQRANNPNRVDGREKYAQSESGKRAQGEAKKRWIESNLIKRVAHIIFRNATRSRPELIKHECESCGISQVRLNGHHDDYSEPLVVRFLCGKCHSQWHKEHGQGLNG